MSVAAILWCALLLSAPPAGHAREPVPAYDPQGYVSDHAGVIDAEWRERIRSVCQDLERKTGVEMVVVTVPSLKPYGSANDYALGLYRSGASGRPRMNMECLSYCPYKSARRP